MSYAVRKDGLGWRRIDSQGDVMEGEVFSIDQPPIIYRVSTVSRLQAISALHQAGLLSDIERYMADQSTDYLTKLAWENAQEFRRESPLVESIGALIGITPSQLDDLFTFASTITA